MPESKCVEHTMEYPPMNRYTNPIPTGRPELSANCPLRQESIDCLLSSLICQNQILTDLLGAINSLTAALLMHRT